LPSATLVVVGLMLVTFQRRVEPVLSIMVSDSTSAAVWAGRLRHSSGGLMLVPSQVYCAGSAVFSPGNAGLAIAIVPGGTTGL
jgi:hypothetical protein